MRLSRTDLVPVLAIVAGGVIGASLSFSFLGSRSVEVPAPEWEVPKRIGVDGMMVLTGAMVEVEIAFERAVLLVHAQQEEALARARALAAGTRRIEVVRVRLVPSQEGAMTCFLNGAVYRFRSVDGDPEWVELSSDGQRIESSRNPAPICIVGVEEEAATQYLLQLRSIGPKIMDNLVEEDIEDIEVVLAAAAVRRYGDEASNGAILITLKEEWRRRR